MELVEGRWKKRGTKDVKKRGARGMEEGFFFLGLNSSHLPTSHLVRPSSPSQHRFYTTARCHAGSIQKLI